MNLTLKRTHHLQGEITPPSSKSQSIRAILLALLCQGQSVLVNVLHSNDTKDAIMVCKSLGANIIESDHMLIIDTEGLPLKTLETEIFSGNSGITTRFIMPILGLRANPQQSIILNCAEQMRARPIKALVDALTHLGLKIEYLNGPDTLPVRISGTLKGGKTWVDGITSQYLSALLLTLPCAQADSEIKVKNLQERSYVEMTLNWLSKQRIQFKHVAKKNIDTYMIQGRQHYKNFHAHIPCDFSSASYLIAASVLIPGEVILYGLDMNDSQGDKQLIVILKEMGADICIEPTQLRIRGGKKLSGIKIDANLIPDLLPTLAVIGTYASGKTQIYNVAQARIKETDRIHSMADGLVRMGAKIKEHVDGLTVHQSILHGNAVKGYDDHRTVMALSIAGMIASGTTIIDESEAINKTFPTFIKTMQLLGARMEQQKIENQMGSKHAIFI